MDVQLGNPHALWLLWLLPAVTGFAIYAERTKRKLLTRFASPRLLPRILRGYSPTHRRWKWALVITAIGLVAFALAEPKFGFTWEEVKRRGVDVVLAIDVSDSMLVKDAEPGASGLTRLERAKREIKDLLQLLDGDRIALVAFAGTAFIECPLTLDYTAAELFLDDIDTDLIPIKGTALGAALETSLQAFDESPQASKAIILITDGEDHTGRALEVAEEAKTAGARVYTIGIGRDEGSPIPDGQGGFRRDRKGELILSKLDETTLQRIALTTGGAYVRSVTGDVDLEKIYTDGIKADLQARELASRRRQRWEHRFQWVLALAALLLMVEGVLSERPRRNDRATVVMEAPAPKDYKEAA